MKTRKGVQKIYAEVAGTYEIVNHVLTLGLDTYWRKKAVREVLKVPGTLLMDMCSGTGEIAQYLKKETGSQAHIVSVDFSFPMLRLAKLKPCANRILFVLGDGLSLPFPDRVFDSIVISFATRNLNVRREILIEHLKEFHRVLKPEGRFINLETSQPSNALVRNLFHLYIKWAIVPVGSFFSGSRPGYRYLAHTIPRFYPAREYQRILHESGFASVCYRTYLFGVAALHSAVK